MMTMDERHSLELLQSDLQEVFAKLGDILARKHHSGLDFVEYVSHVEGHIKMAQNVTFLALRDVGRTFERDNAAREVFMNEEVNVEEELKTELAMRGELKTDEVWF